VYYAFRPVLAAGDTAGKADALLFAPIFWEGYRVKASYYHEKYKPRRAGGLNPAEGAVFYANNCYFNLF
jgi:hypothetical protein